MKPSTGQAPSSSIGRPISRLAAMAPRISHLKPSGDRLRWGTQRGGEVDGRVMRRGAFSHAMKLYGPDEASRHPGVLRPPQEGDAGARDRAGIRQRLPAAGRRSCCRPRRPTSASTGPPTPLFKIVKTPAQMLALGEKKLIGYIKTIGLFRIKAKNVIALEPAADREARRRGAAHPRGAAGPARRRPQDRQRGDERGFRRGDHRRRHPHLPRRQPHRPGARQEPARGRAEAVEARARGIPPARPPLADPARPLHLQGAQARMPALRGERPLPVQGEDDRL